MLFVDHLTSQLLQIFNTLHMFSQRTSFDLLTQSTQSTYKKRTKIYGTAGILWLVNKDKLVDAGFTPGSKSKHATV